MSDALTDTAPSEGTAATPVGDEAPVTEPAVVEASGQGDDTKFVEAARFNGLMSKFNKTQEQLLAEQRAREELAAEVSALRAELSNRTEPAQETEPVSEASATPSALEQQVEFLAQELLRERAEKAREQAVQTALAKYPEAAPFADMLVGESPEQFEQVASDIAERVKTLGVSAPSNTPPAEPVTEAPVTGGGPGLVPDGGANFEDKIAAAIENRDFRTYLRLKQEAALAGAGEQLVLDS